MKSQVNPKYKGPRPFPKLMSLKQRPDVVIFAERMDSGHLVGTRLIKPFETSTEWIADVFEDFEGTITLSND